MIRIIERRSRHRSCQLSTKPGTSSVEGLPDVDETVKPADLLAVAEVLNGTLDAFLSPEEGEEKRKFFGFDRVDVGLGPLRLGLGRGRDA